MFKKLLDKITRGNTLYYPGCLTHFVLPEIEENYQKILRQIGIDFIFLPEFNCCGSPVLNAGYQGDFETLKGKNTNFFRRYGVSKIITNCPACYRVLADYEAGGLKVEHMIQVVDKKIDRISAKHTGDITYHDPCHLGRQSGIFEEPRHILRSVGFKVVELRFCKDESMCCGGGAGLKTNYPNISDEIAKMILEKVQTEKLVTPCPLCYKHLRDNSDGIEVLEFSEVLV